MGSPTSSLPALSVKAAFADRGLPPPLLQDKEPRGIIPLENLSVQKVDDPKKPVGGAAGS